MTAEERKEIRGGLTMGIAVWIATIAVCCACGGCESRPLAGVKPPPANEHSVLVLPPEVEQRIADIEAGRVVQNQINNKVEECVRDTLAILEKFDERLAALERPIVSVPDTEKPLVQGAVTPAIGWKPPPCPPPKPSQHGGHK